MTLFEGAEFPRKEASKVSLSFRQRKEGAVGIPLRKGRGKKERSGI